MINEYLDALSDDMVSTVEALENSLKSIRTGRATPALLDGVRVEVASYGATMPINQLATVNAPEPRLLVVNPWDKNTVSDVERAIGAAGLGLNPASDGQIIRVPIPPLTDERRRQLARKVRDLGEQARIRARAVRKEYNDLFKELESDSEISEDQLRRQLENVQSATDECVEKINVIVSAKEKEIRTL